MMTGIGGEIGPVDIRDEETRRNEIHIQQVAGKEIQKAMTDES